MYVYLIPQIIKNWLFYTNFVVNEKNETQHAAQIDSIQAFCNIECSMNYVIEKMPNKIIQFLPYC